MSPITIVSWLSRIAFAALLAFGSEIVLWNTPQRRSALDVLLLIAGYLAVATLVLDFVVRYSLRSFFGVLLLGGIYGLVNALTLNPHTMLVDGAPNVAARALGGHTLNGIAIFAFVFWIAGYGRGWWTMPAAVIAGIVCGLLTDAPFSMPDTSGHIFALMVGTVVTLSLGNLVLRAVLRTSVEPGWVESLRLGDIEITLVVASLAGLAAFRFSRGEGITWLWIFALVLLALCWATLWFGKRDKPVHYLLLLNNVRLRPSFTVNAATSLFLLTTIAVSWLPRDINGVDVPLVLRTAFTAVGLVWLPTLALVLGGRAILREVRALRL
ncbi:MAG: hypothetical protein SF123_07500 [Chloroflexota bacterium]|nr:hypothetical protein [Chloroflexota bacterium]